MIKFWFDKFREGRASHRLRASIPCKALTEQGINSQITNDINSITEEDIVIVQKDSLLENFRKLKQTNAKIGFDLCDNKFEEHSHYYDFCKEADFITVNSITMAEVVKENTGRDSFYYADCVDREIIPPTIRPIEGPIKLLWYGTSSSNKYVDWAAVTNQLEDSGIDYRITVLCDRAEYIRKKITNNLRKNNPRFNMNKMENIDWTWNLQQQLVERSDIVFIPLLEQNERRTKTKSHNRVVDGIAQGRWVVTSELPSYRILKDYCWLGDPVEGIRFYMRNPGEANKKIINGQDWIKQNASAESVAKNLINIYSEVMK